MNRGTTNTTNGLIWFGAAVSIAEILTGTYFAPLGFWKALQAVVLGHLIGGTLMGTVAYISAKERVPAMEAVKMTFGQKGRLLFALLNALQLICWTAIMIYDGALAAGEAWGTGFTLWCILIGLLIAVWLADGLNGEGPIHKVAMTTLFLLTVVLCAVIARSPTAPMALSPDSLSFGAAVELAAAMPLSWLPVIGDYTCNVKHPKAGTWISVIIYNLTSIWMYMIGTAAALFTGQSDIVKIMSGAGLGIGALFIVVFSTVTTTYLDAFSAGVSLKALSPKINSTAVALLTALAGTAAAIVWRPDDITPFLYYIGSVFAPMTAVMLADYYLHKAPARHRSFGTIQLIIWAGGFILYRHTMNMDLPVGNTPPVITALFILTGIILTITKKGKS